MAGEWQEEAALRKRLAILEDAHIETVRELYEVQVKGVSELEQQVRREEVMQSKYWAKETLDELSQDDNDTVECSTYFHVPMVIEACLEIKTQVLRSLKDDKEAVKTALVRALRDSVGSINPAYEITYDAFDLMDVVDSLISEKLEEESVLADCALQIVESSDIKIKENT